MFNRNAGRKRDLVWNYFHKIETEKSGCRAKCKRCGQEVQGLVDRLKKHHLICEVQIIEVCESADSEQVQSVDCIETPVPVASTSKNAQGKYLIETVDLVISLLIRHFMQEILNAQEVV